MPVTILLSLSSAVVSGIVVAVISHILTERRNRRDDLAELRLAAYSDFIHATSRLVVTRRFGQAEHELDQLSALNDAKARICICAEARVVDALSEFWDAGGTLETESEILAFTRLCTRMRESLGNRRRDIARLNLLDTLFQLEPASYSYQVEKLKALNIGQ